MLFCSATISRNWCALPSKLYVWTSPPFIDLATALPGNSLEMVGFCWIAIDLDRVTSTVALPNDDWAMLNVSNRMPATSVNRREIQVSIGISFSFLLQTDCWIYVEAVPTWLVELPVWPGTHDFSLRYEISTQNDESCRRSARTGGLYVKLILIVNNCATPRTFYFTLITSDEGCEENSSYDRKEFQQMTEWSA